MHDHDAWAGLNGEKHKGKHLHTWILFKDCLELHKLTIFSTDAAKRQKFYIQQRVQKPQWASIHQYVSHIEELHGYLKHLIMLKNSPKAVSTTKKGNIPFSEGDSTGFCTHLMESHALYGTRSTMYATTRPREY
jgi:hypothetical protein